MQRWQGEGGASELLQLAWPLILGNSFWTIQIALDRVLLSRAGSELVGAAMAAALLFWTPITLLQYTANYATTFVAQYTGAGQHHRVGPVVWQALHFSLITGVAFLGLIPLAPWIVKLGGHAPELQKHEVVYFQCLCFSALPTLVIAAVSSFFAGRGDSRTVLLVNAVSVIVNAPLAYAWIYGRWGFPARGIEGAGWATVVATSASALVAIGLMLRRRHREVFATASGWRLEGELLRRLLRFGLPNGFLVAMDTLVFTLFLILVGRDARGLLQETLVYWTGDFGRTPKINKDAGRDHWPPCQTVLMAGGGIHGGQVYGASDSTGAFPSDKPVRPDDITATLFHALGFDPDTTIVDQLKRPVPISAGKPLTSLFG